MTKYSIDAQIAEVERELAMRAKALGAVTGQVVIGKQKFAL